MPDKIPPIDPDLKPHQENNRAAQEELEFELLRTEANLLRLNEKEKKQLHHIKWIAVATGWLVLLFMMAILWHLLHEVFWGPFLLVSPAFSVAMIVAPIFSITTITVAIFVGAFRKFEGKDLEVVGKGATGAASVLGG